MFQQTPLDRLNKGQNIIDSNVSIKLRDKIYKIVLYLTKAKVKYKIVKDNKFKKIDGHPIILAANHTRFQDTPIMCQILREELNERGYIFAGKQRLNFINNLFFYLYGSIFLDRKNKDDMKIAQEAMEKYLDLNRTIIEFPEATWNMTDELLMLPMKWGIIKSAQKTDAQILPVVLNYDDCNKECHVKFLDPLLVPKDADIKEYIDNFRFNMATARFDYITEEVSRKMLDVNAEKENQEKVLDECPDYDVYYERSIIYKPYPSNEEVFESVKKLELKKETAFLFYKNNKGIR